MGKMQTPQPMLFAAPIEKDVVYTPAWLAQLIVQHFAPVGRCLDPCRGDGAFHSLLPEGSDWCEVDAGRDFFAFAGMVDWVIGNPPYSCLMWWVRHSFTVADNVVYLVPLHRLLVSHDFLKLVRAYGGLKEVLCLGTGRDVGFPFGHALAVVHYQRGYRGPTYWSHRDEKPNGALSGLPKASPPRMRG